MECKRPGCSEAENRINGYCSNYCEDMHDMESQLAAAVERAEKAERERDEARAWILSALEAIDYRESGELEWTPEFVEAANTYAKEFDAAVERGQSLAADRDRLAGEVAALRKRDWLGMVRQFHEAGRLAIQDRPVWNETCHYLRVGLHREEFGELEAAFRDRDLVETADALADLIYVLCGTALTMGIPLADVFAEVHRSNMSKFIGGLIRREDGKILKGPNYSPPDIRAILQPAQGEAPADAKGESPSGEPRGKGGEA